MIDWLRTLWSRPALDAAERAELGAWQQDNRPALKQPAIQARWVVVDVETTGLNLLTDRLISIGAVAVVNGRIDLADHFSVVLQQRASSSKENILVHGISDTEQREGVLPVRALLDFLAYLGNSPLVAFHVKFDATMIGRALRQHLGLKFDHPWLDLAYLMPALEPERMHSHRVLDDWLSAYDIHTVFRHHALADALVTAQLLLIAQQRGRAKGLESYAALQGLERSYRSARGLL